MNQFDNKVQLPLGVICQCYVCLLYLKELDFELKGGEEYYQLTDVFSMS